VNRLDRCGLPATFLVQILGGECSDCFSWIYYWELILKLNSACNVRANALCQLWPILTEYDERGTERETILRATEDIRAKHRSRIIISTVYVNAHASMDSSPVISSLRHDATLRHKIASNLWFTIQLKMSTDEKRLSQMTFNFWRIDKLNMTNFCLKYF